MCNYTHKETQGNQIELKRKLRGWSQEELANRCGSTQQQISNIESGRRKLTWDWMKRVADALQCHPMELVYWNDRQHRSVDVNTTSIISY